MGGHEAQTKCGLAELFIFIGALIGGTACSLTSKVFQIIVNNIRNVKLSSIDAT